MLPRSFIQDLLARVDIVEVVGRHVELKRAGVNHKGLCPFHGEKTPSFIVSPARQSYHCFGCGAHGDAIRFLVEHDGLGFIDAVHELAQGTGIELPQSNPEERALADTQREQRRTLGETLARAAAHYRRALKDSPRAIDYLKRRGLSGEIAARFGLGWASEGWRTLAGVFAHYDDPLLVDAGLVIVHEAGEGATERRYDRFRERIMFPIRSMRGEVIGFGARVLDRSEPKYLNSPETAVFQKGRELYGLYEARAALRERGCALVVEGYMDVVALAQSGFANAVATLGTACTAEHLALLFRFTDSVVFSFDGDAAGRRAAARALEAALAHASDARTIRFLFLPPEHDPDSYVREFGAAAFEQLVDGAQPLSACLLDLAAEGCDLEVAEGRAKMLARARGLVEQLPAGLLREQLVARLAQRGGVAPATLKSHWNAQPPPASSPRDASAPIAAPIRSRPGRAPPQAATALERAAWLLARYPERWLDLGADEHELLARQPAPYGLLFTRLERAIHDHGPMQMAALLGEIARGDDGELLAPLLDRLAGFIEVEDGTGAAAAIGVLIQRLRAEALDDELRLLAELGELDETERSRYRRLDALRQALRSSAA